MNSFIKSIVGAEERIMLLIRLHWIYFLMGFWWLVLLTGAGVALDYYLWIYFGSSVPTAAEGSFGLLLNIKAPLMSCIFGFSGALILLMHLVKMLATEIALTNQRIIYKTGLIFVEVEEIDLVEIRAERVRHGLLGRFLGYGQLCLDSRFVGDIHLPAIRDPYRLIKAMHAARSRIHDPMDDVAGRTSRAAGT